MEPATLLNHASRPVVFCADDGVLEMGKEDDLTMAGHEVYGFTPADRDTLVTLKVQLEFLGKSVSDAVVRIGRLEESRVSQKELLDLYSDTDTLRAEKKELEKKLEDKTKSLSLEIETRTAKIDAEVALKTTELSNRVTTLERAYWKAIGASAGAGAVIGLIFRLIK